MKKEVLVSVVIPAYNHELYAQNSIKSIISQTYKRIELIVIDDGSTDETWNKIIELKNVCENRFERVVFQTQKNIGTGATLNELIGLCKGDYVYVIASDDVSVPTAIREQLECLRVEKKYALCVGDNAFIDSAGNECYQDANGNFTNDKKSAKFFTFGQALQFSRKLNFATDDFGKYSELYKINHVPNGYLIRKKALKGFRFSTDAPLEDWALMLFLAKYYKFKYINKVLFKYRQHNANTIKNVGSIYKKDLRTRLNEQAVLRTLRLWRCLPGVRVFAGEKKRELERMWRLLLKGTIVQKNVNYCIDSKVFDGNGTYIYGWAFCTNEICRVFIKHEKVFYDTIAQLRPDVQLAFNLDNDKQGFSAFVPVELGDYSLHLVNMEKNEVYVCKIESNKNC